MSLTRFNLALIAGLLLGYAFLDKGFAYVGYFPVFIGEITLVMMIMITVLTGTNAQFLRSPITITLLIFISWQTLILLFSSHGTWVNALRDSVTWSYAIFTLLVAGLLLRAGALTDTLKWYGRWMPWFVVLSAPMFILADRFGQFMPLYPGTIVSILNIKAGDYGVHLAGAAAFYTLGLFKEFSTSRSNWFGLKDIVFAISMMMGVISIGSRTRGGLLSVVLAVVICFVFRPNNRLGRLLFPAAIVLFILSAFDITIPTGYREISVNQILNNVQSVIFDTDEKQLNDTANWRIEWWKAILDDIFNGEIFWTGIGFGNSLAATYDFADDTGNRSPHNAHLTILARTGVPGFLLWMVFILTTYTVLTFGYLNANVNNQMTLAKINVWIMAYFTAFLVNMSFDVYLEGPQGGIWFWCLVGYAAALNRAQRMNMNRMAAHHVAPPQRLHTVTVDR